MSDPFTLLDLENKYFLDINYLDKAYFDAQKKTHPDQFLKASPEEKQGASHRSAALNQAYSLLKDPLKRAELLLSQENIDLLSHDPLFLEKVMEWREAAATGKDIRGDLLTLEFNLFNELEDSFNKKDFNSARQALYQLTYVQKLLKEGI